MIRYVLGHQQLKKRFMNLLENLKYLEKHLKIKLHLLTLSDINTVIWVYSFKSSLIMIDLRYCGGFLRHIIHMNKFDKSSGRLIF